MKVSNINRIKNIIIKNTITDFCKDKLVRNFIKLQYSFFKKKSIVCGAPARI